MRSRYQGRLYCSRLGRAAACVVLLLVGSLTARAHVLAVAAETPGVGTGLNVDQLKLIHLRLQELVDREVIPGAVALVARHGEVAYLDATGYQNWEKKTPMRTDSIFQIMSMTKPFTGVAIMMLVEEGKLELRRPGSDYLPEFKDQEVEQVSFNNQVTLHKPVNPAAVWQLMCHTSGLNGDGLTFEVLNKPEGQLLLSSPGSFGHGGAFGTEGWMDPQNDLIRILMTQVSDGTGGSARAVVMQIGEAAVMQ